MRNEFDNEEAEASTAANAEKMTIDDNESNEPCVNENEIYLSENENLLEEDNNLSSENNNSSKSENESIYDSFDDNNAFETLQTGLYSSDDELSDNGIDLIAGNI